MALKTTSGWLPSSLDPSGSLLRHFQEQKTRLWTLLPGDASGDSTCSRSCLSCSSEFSWSILEWCVVRFYLLGTTLTATLSLRYNFSILQNSMREEIRKAARRFAFPCLAAVLAPGVAHNYTPYIACNAIIVFYYAVARSGYMALSLKYMSASTTSTTKKSPFLLKSGASNAPRIIE